MFSVRFFGSASTPSSPCLAERPRPIWGVVLVAGLVTAVLGWRATCGLADELPDRPPQRDVYLTMKARDALQHDPLLQSLNLGVRVKDRVATLWGPVPSQEAMTRAIEVLRRMPDLLNVRNELHLDSPEEARPQYLPDQLPQAPMVPPPPPPPLPGLSREDSVRSVLTRRPVGNDELPPPPQSPRVPPAATPPGFPATRDDPNEAVLPAIAVPRAELPSDRPLAGSVHGWSSLQLAVNSLRMADSRFTGLRAEVRDRQVVLSGSAARWDDVRDFAAGLNRLPGVERVILGPVQADR